MKKYIYTLITALCAVSYNAVSQSISFSYDADGNMSSLTVVTLKSAEFDANDDEAEEDDLLTEIVTVELGAQKITVYPNPTRGRILVEIQPLGYEEENFLRLFNSQGQLMETVHITQERTQLEISGSAGVYLLDVHLGASVSRWKIIKQ